MKHTRATQPTPDKEGIQQKMAAALTQVEEHRIHQHHLLSPAVFRSRPELGKQGSEQPIEHLN
jgi:hypothetical protein